MKALELTGQKFGRLTVIERTDLHKGKKVLWRCLCECGEERLVGTGSLTSGNSKSCGCLDREKASERRRLDLTGQRFGRLVAIKPLSERRRGAIVWVCKCDCGQEVERPTHDLRCGHTKSCGCLFTDMITGGKTHPRYKHGMAHTAAYQREHNAKRRALIGDYFYSNISYHDMQVKIEEAGEMCVYCGAPYEHLDHVIPLSKGGKHEIDNIVTACAKCNHSKKDKILGVEWFPPLPLLSTNLVNISGGQIGY